MRINALRASDVDRGAATIKARSAKKGGRKKKKEGRKEKKKEKKEKEKEKRLSSKVIHTASCNRYANYQIIYA